MRILITEKGEKLIQEIEENEAYAKMNRKDLPNSVRGNTVSHFNSYRGHQRNKNRKETKQPSFDIDEVKNIEEMNMTDLSNTRSIKLHVNKLNFPKNFVHKYEQDTTQTKNIISTTDSFLPSIAGRTMPIQTDDSLGSMSKLYSFNEIIPKTTIYSMKKKIIQDKRNKMKLSRVTDQNFRSVYEMRSDLEEFDRVLEKPKVAPNKVSLIKYLNEKKNINPTILKGLVESDPDRLNRVNKMCQILFYDEEQQKMMDESIKEKLRQKVNSERLEFQAKIKEMKGEIDGIKEKLNKYRRRVNDRERYRDLYNDLVIHHWAKYDFDRLNKKKNLMRRVNKIVEEKDPDLLEEIEKKDDVEKKN